MSIASTTRKAGPFTGNGLTTIFPFTFKVFQASDLLVVRTNLSGVETTLTLTTDYTVSLNANQDSNPGGTVTALSAPASGFLLTMTSNVPELQPVVLTNMGGFYPKVINDALDRLTIFTQQISEKLGRALTLPISAPNGVSTQLPFPAANKIIAWNENANGLQSMDPSELATVVSFGTAKADIFSGNASTTQFTLTASPGALNNLDVSISGVTQKPGIDYTWSSGTTITFTSAPPTGTNNILVRYLQALPQGISDANSCATSGSGLWGTVQGFINYIQTSLGSSLVGFLPAGTGAVTRTVQSKLRETVSVADFGADPTGTNDSYAAIAAAIAYAQTVGLADGATVYFPTGTYRISQTVMMPNRIGLQGANGRATTIKPHSSFSSAYMFHAVNGTASMFGSWIKDMNIDSRGKNMTYVVRSDAWQETCGMERVCILFDGTTNAGLGYANGYGGAAYLLLKDCEIFANSTYSSAAGVLVGQVSGVGGFVLSWQGGTITGSATNVLPSGIRMVNDSLHVNVYHGEYVLNMITMSGIGSLSADTVTGSFAAVTNIVSLSSTFTGKVALRNIIPNGATSNILNDGVANRHISATEGMLSDYTYQPSSFAAYASSTLSAVTGDDTELYVNFNTEIHDYLGEYNISSGAFTAARTGKYIFEVALQANVPTGSTVTVLYLATSNRVYELFRGTVANIRDTSNNVILRGTVVADMDAGDTARVGFGVYGLGAKTVNILGTNSRFSGQWLAR